MSYDLWLENQAEEYYRECEPRGDSQGNCINCPECDNSECEHYLEFNEEKKENKHV